MVVMKYDVNRRLQCIVAQVAGRQKTAAVTMAAAVTLVAAIHLQILDHLHQTQDHLQAREPAKVSLSTKGRTASATTYQIPLRQIQRRAALFAPQMQDAKPSHGPSLMEVAKNRALAI